MAFDAELQERYTTDRGSEYVRLTLGAPEGSGDPADVIDAEFIFLTGARSHRVQHNNKTMPCFQDVGQVYESCEDHRRCETVFFLPEFHSYILVSMLCVALTQQHIHWAVYVCSIHSGDRIVNVRASSRAQPGPRQGRLQLSLESGVVFDRNRARQRLETLRQVNGKYIMRCDDC